MEVGGSWRPSPRLSNLILNTMPTHQLQWWRACLCQTKVHIQHAVLAAGLRVPARCAGARSGHLLIRAPAAKAFDLSAKCTMPPLSGNLQPREVPLQLVRQFRRSRRIGVVHGTSRPSKEIAASQPQWPGYVQSMIY